MPNKRLTKENDSQSKPNSLLSFLDELAQLPFSIRSTEAMNADIQAERDAWDDEPDSRQ